MWQLWVVTSTPVQQRHLVATYATQNLARWWAVAFAERGSVSLEQGTPNEQLIPMSHVWRFEIKEAQ